MRTATIEIDLFHDLVENVSGKLIDAGYVVPSTYSPREILYAWANVRRRIPAVRPRRVERSREFLCPPQHLPGLAIVEKKLAAGESLRPHLSRRVFQLDYHDALLNDWGIQHLHLGTTSLPNGLVTGTSEIAFCILEPDDAYLIQVMDHHKFSEPDLLDVVNWNWPHLLQRLPLSAGKRQTAADIDKLRKAGVLSIVGLMDGTAVAPRGGGYSSTGHSVQAMITANYWASMTERWEQFVRAAADKLAEDARQRGIEIPTTIRFELWEDHAKWFAVAPLLKAGIGLPT